MEIQWTYWQTMVYRKRDFCQHILLAPSGFAQKSLWDFGSSGCWRTEIGSRPDPSLGNEKAYFRYRCLTYDFDLSGNAGCPYWDSWAGRGGCDPEYSFCPAAALLDELSGVTKFFLLTGYTDTRKSIDSLMAITWNTYELNPYSNSMFLFWSRIRNLQDEISFSDHEVQRNTGAVFWGDDASFSSVKEIVLWVTGASHWSGFTAAGNDGFQNSQKLSCIGSAASRSAVF